MGIPNFEFDYGAAVVDNNCDPILSDPNLPECDNCGNNNFDVDEARADLVCHSCGLCLGGLAVSVPDRATFSNAGGHTVPSLSENMRGMAFAGPASHTKSAKTHGKYKRQVYLREKLRQWCLSESRIPEEDWQIIIRAYLNYADNTIKMPVWIPSTRQLQACRGQGIKDLPVLGKEDIRCLLHDCDTLVRSTYAWQCDPERSKRPSFITKYYEKWLTIRWRLSGKTTTAGQLTPSLMEFILDTFTQLDKVFKQLSFSPRTRRTKKSFPNYNTTLFRILELKGYGSLGVDFPTLSTRRAKKKFEITWWQFCKYLQWPYISRDAHILTHAIKAKLI